MIKKLIRIDVGEYEPKNHSYVNREKINEIIDTLNKLTKEEEVGRYTPTGYVPKTASEDQDRYDEELVRSTLSTYKARLREKVSKL